MFWIKISEKEMAGRRGGESIPLAGDTKGQPRDSQPWQEGNSSSAAGPAQLLELFGSGKRKKSRSKRGGQENAKRESTEKWEEPRVGSTPGEGLGRGGSPSSGRSRIVPSEREFLLLLTAPPRPTDIIQLSFHF